MRNRCKERVARVERSGTRGRATEATRNHASRHLFFAVLLKGDRSRVPLRSTRATRTLGIFRGFEILVASSTWNVVPGESANEGSASFDRLAVGSSVSVSRRADDAGRR